MMRYYMWCGLLQKNAFEDVQLQYCFFFYMQCSLQNVENFCMGSNLKLYRIWDHFHTRQLFLSLCCMQEVLGQPMIRREGRTCLCVVYCKNHLGK